MKVLKCANGTEKSMYFFFLGCKSFRQKLGVFKLFSPTPTPPKMLINSIA